MIRPSSQALQISRKLVRHFSDDILVKFPLGVTLFRSSLLVMILSYVRTLTFPLLPISETLRSFFLVICSLSTELHEGTPEEHFDLHVFRSTSVTKFVEALGDC